MTDDSVLEDGDLRAANRILSWPQQKLALETYHRMLADNAIQNLWPDAIEGLQKATHAIVIGTVTTLDLALEQDESPKTAALWTAARLCHDVCTQTAASLEVAVEDLEFLGEETTQQMVGPLAVITQMMALVGEALIDAAQEAAQDT